MGQPTAAKHSASKQYWSASRDSSRTYSSSSYHVHVLVLMEPLARHPSVKSEEGEGTEHVLIQLQVIAVYVMRHLQEACAGISLRDSMLRMFHKMGKCRPAAKWLIPNLITCVSFRKSLPKKIAAIWFVPPIREHTDTCYIVQV